MTKELNIEQEVSVQTLATTADSLTAHLRAAQNALKEVEGEPLSKRDALMLNELITATKHLKKDAIAKFVTMGFSNEVVGKAFDLSPGRVSQIVKELKEGN